MKAEMKLMRKVYKSLRRIDGKCDIIIRELAARTDGCVTRRDGIDRAIDRLHQAAQSLRRQSLDERVRLTGKSK